jgi:hypothetical protein
MSLIERARAAARAKHEPPWAEGELPRIGVQVKALAKRDRRDWWRLQKREGRRLLKRAES